MLHRFQDPSIGFTEPGAVFAEYLEKCIVYLIQNDFKISPINSIVQDIREGKNAKRNIVFTVDDGYIDFKNVAYPVFKKYNVPVMVFLTTRFIDGKLMQWWDQLSYILSKTNKSELDLDWEGKTIHFQIDSDESRKGCYKFFLSQLKNLTQKERNNRVKALASRFDVELPESPPLEYSALSWDDVCNLKENGVDFGAHTVTHPILGNESRSKQQREICLSLRIMEEKLGFRPEVFCYPNGKNADYNSVTISLLKNENVIAAVTAEPGFIGGSRNNTSDQFYYQLPRFSFPINFPHFVQCVSGLELLKNVMLGRK